MFEALGIFLGFDFPHSIIPVTWKATPKDRWIRGYSVTMYPRIHFVTTYPGIHLVNIF